MISKSEHYKQMIKYWDSQARFFSGFKNKSRTINKILKIIQKRKCKNILEIGCGFAEDSIAITKMSKCKITCIDFSPEMIKKAKYRIREKNLEKQISFILGNIVDIKLNENFFDGIIAKSVLHHLFSKNDIISSCTKIYKSLRPNGIFILVENWASPNPSKYEGLAFRLSQKARKLKGIKEVFLKKDEYLSILRKIGFRDIKWSFIEENINISRYALNKALKRDVNKIKLAFPKGKVKTLFITAYK